MKHEADPKYLIDRPLGHTGEGGGRFSFSDSHRVSHAYNIPKGAVRVKVSFEYVATFYDSKGRAIGNPGEIEYDSWMVEYSNYPHMYDRYCEHCAKEEPYYLSRIRCPSCGEI